ncbi:MAG: hypothetical protein ACFFFC_12075 [Candidatus Thorarchaeota archaeon]
MKKKESEKKGIRRELLDLETQRRDRLMELRGIDPEKIKALDEDIDKQYQELMERVVKQMQPGLEQRVKKQEKSTSRYIGIQKAIGDFREALKGYKVAVLACGCTYKEDPPCEYDHHCPEDFDIKIDDSPATLADALANSYVDMILTYNVGLKQAQPRIEVRGERGATHNGSSTSCLVYKYRPKEDGTYCIKPEFKLVGYWLLWPRNRGDCTGTTDIGRGSVEAYLQIRAFQTGEFKGETALWPLMRKNINPLVEQEGFETLSGDQEGFLYFDSNDSPGPALTVNLDGDEDTEIRVQALFKAEVANGGWAIIDLSDGAASYYRVPQVETGPYINCWWWYKEPWLEAFKDRLYIFHEWPFKEKTDIPPKPCWPGPDPVPEI